MWVLPYAFLSSSLRVSEEDCILIQQEPFIRSAESLPGIPPLSSTCHTPNIPSSSPGEYNGMIVRGKPENKDERGGANTRIEPACPRSVAAWGQRWGQGGGVARGQEEAFQEEEG